MHPGPTEPLDSSLQPPANAPGAFDSAPLATQVAKPVLGVRFLLSHPAHFFALGLGSGLSRIAPGTAGTLWAWAAFAVLQPHMNDLYWAVLLGFSLLAGTWACTVTARHMQVQDPGAVARTRGNHQNGVCTTIKSALFRTP